MKVLLTGAGGNIGLETLRQLMEKGKYDVTAIDLPSKRNKKRLKPFLDKADIRYGSINDKDFIEDAIKDCDAVIHLAAVIPPLADREPELTRQVNFFGTQTIIEAIRKVEPKCFLLYSSSVSVYGDRVKDPYIKVMDPLNPSQGDYYAITKIATEEMIQNADIAYSIFRLTGIMGRPDIDPLMFHMPLDTKLEIATTLDTARAFVNALEHFNELQGRIFNLGGGEECRTNYRDFLIHMFQIYGLNFTQFRIFAFAEKNFHCGYFADGDELNDILDFRQDTLQTYYERINQETKKITRFFTKMFSRPILYFLSKKSDPMKAQKKQDSSLLDRFFKKK